jgi:hypothetical protein
MAETFFDVRNSQVVTLRVDPTEVRGEGSAARPVLHLPLKVQILPTRGDQGDVNYVLLRLAGRLGSPGIGEFAEFELPPLLEESRADPYFRDLPVKVVFDRARIRQFEDARSEAKAHFAVSFSALMWFAKDQKFEKTYSNSPLQVIVPRSHWVDDVLSRWGLSSVKMVEITFPASEVGETFRSAYARVESAEKLFANGHYRQVLTELRLAFEGLANSLGFEQRMKECFDHLLAEFGGEKKEKAREAMLNLYRFLHLGPHEQVQAPETAEEPAITRSDARFALVMTYAVFEYITPER